MPSQTPPSSWRHPTAWCSGGVQVAGLFVAFNMSFNRLWLAVFPGVTLNGSLGYIPAALALLIVGSLCLHLNMRRPGRALLLAVGVFTLSLAFRSADISLCPSLPIETHFLWHVLNALVLGTLMRAAIVHVFHKRLKHAPG